jgi:ankyrin repeat protein
MGGETSLFYACKHGHLQVAKILIEAGGDALVFKTNKDGCSCLHLHAASGTGDDTCSSLAFDSIF